MIIKSLSRKKATYGQLLAYISKNAAPHFEIRHNVPFEPELERIRLHFERLAEQLPERKNGNKLYHEILSIPRRDGLDLARQQQALYALCQEYIKHRAPDHAVYGQMHLEGHHLHAHLVISPNSLSAPTKRVRIAKTKYNEIQKELEGWMMAMFPELEQALVYTKDAPGRRRPEKEAQYEQRTGKASKKAQLRLALEHLMSQAESQQAFAALLERYGMTFYMRGQVPGIQTENRRYRLSTLGLAEQFTELTQQPTLETEPGAAAPAPDLCSETGDCQQEQEPTISAGDYSTRRAELAAERLAKVLRDLFAYSPDVVGLVEGLQQYGIRLDERPNGVWCVHEGVEAPLASMGLMEAYQAAWQRLAPDSAPEIPAPETRKVKLDHDRLQPEKKKEPSHRLRQLEEIRAYQREHPDLDEPEFI